MRVPILMLMALLCAWSPAMTQSNMLKPGRLVEARQGQYFEPVTPFRVSSEIGNLRESLTDYQLLDPDPAILQRLHREAPPQIQLNLPLEEQGQLALQLVRVELFDPAFAVYESGGDRPVEFADGVHYRGIIAGDPASVVAISIFADEVMGLVSSGNLGNRVLGRLRGEDPARRHIFYRDREVLEQEAFDCATPDGPAGYATEQLDWPSGALSAANCVRVYLEVDHDIFLSKGGTSGAAAYVSGLFHQVATLYANENINLVISEMLIWTTQSPYSGTSSTALLDQFQNIRTNFNGDIGQLLSYQASGGVAVLGGLCHPYTQARLSFASIATSFHVVPTYSWSVLVVAHELGHLLGSQHTHACVWNGNNTALDGCAGFTEGSCAWPGWPTAAGTIMSYCHLTQAGIHFNLGFGAQPGNVIRNFVSSAGCLQPCDAGGEDPGGSEPVGNQCGDDHTLYVAITVDDYGPETTWELLDADSNVLFSGGPYPKAAAGETFVDTLCMPDGCYDFAIYDAYGDGICCAYGNGRYELTDSLGVLLAEGAEFGDLARTQICLNAGPAADDCLLIDFNEHPLGSFGGPQDGGYFQLMAGGQILKIGGNAWKAIPLRYDVTTHTVLEFDFGSTSQGEIHGIGLDEDLIASYQRTFKLHGTQPWGLMDFDNYPNQPSWVHYEIPVGVYYTGAMEYLFFVADHDYGAPTGTSYFRNVRIREGDGCPQELPVASERIDAGERGLQLYPNPASDQLNVSFPSEAPGPAELLIYDLQGRPLLQRMLTTRSGGHQETIDLNGLPDGIYLLRLRTAEGEYTEKFSVTN